MSYETAMDQIRRERQTEEKLRKMDVHEMVDLVHSHEDEIERLHVTIQRAKEEYEYAGAIEGWNRPS